MNLVIKLKEFYLLEMFQLTLYESQKESLQNEYISHAYDRIIELERHHVDFYKERFHKLGEDLPIISGGLFSLAGHFFGQTLDLTSAQNRYKIGMYVENKAIEMYRVFIMESYEKYPDICKRLWHNMVDEEFHLLWFKDNLKHTTSLVKST